MGTFNSAHPFLLFRLFVVSIFVFVFRSEESSKKFVSKEKMSHRIEFQMIPAQLKRPYDVKPNASRMKFIFIGFMAILLLHSEKDMCTHTHSLIFA